jgi:2-methylcitrate dehydratase PrpD
MFEYLCRKYLPEKTPPCQYIPPELTWFSKTDIKYSKECLYIKGHPKNPFTLPELINKFRMCVPFSAYKISEPTVQSILDSILSLEQVNDVVGTLIVPLTPE